MKIFYAIQATGNGHVSRAAQLIPFMQKFGEVDAFVSGANATLDMPFDVKYRSKGMSLFYGKCGGLDYGAFLKNTNYMQVRRDAKNLPVDKYDVVINDFEHLTALACKMKNIPSVQFGHQASFMSDKTPRPDKKSWLGELILHKYAVATSYIGLHFQRYEDFIFPPVIKTSLLQALPTNEGHITVYLPAFQQHCLLGYLHDLADVHFHLFLPNIKTIYREKNITYMPVGTELFNKSLITCAGIITGGGFEAPAEALYLGKKLLAIPISGQYEQHCNAAALKLMGVQTLADVTPNFATDIKNWLNTKQLFIKQPANDVMTTLQYLFDTYPSVKYKKENSEPVENFL